MADQQIKTPEETMAEVQTDVQTKAESPAVQQETLSNILKSPEQGGSNIGIPYGTNMPQLLKENPATKQLIEEAIAIQTGRRTITSDKAKQASDALVSDLTKDTNKMFGPPITGTNNAELPGATDQTTANTTGVEPMQLNDNGLTDEQSDLFGRIQNVRDESYNALVDNIKYQMEQDLIATQNAQRQAMGVSKVQLARMGALHVTTAGIQYINDLQNTHTAQLSKIRTQAEQAIREAALAKESGDLELLQQKVAAVRQNRLDIIAEQQAHIQNMVQMAQLTKLQRENISSTLNAIVSSGIDADSVPKDYLTKLDTQGGYAPGTSYSMLVTAKKEYERKNYADDVALKVNIQNLLNSTPLGEKITIGDYAYYGRSTDNIEIDQTGYARRFVTNADGSVGIQDLGRIAENSINFQLIENNGRYYGYDPSTNRLTYIPGLSLDSTAYGANDMSYAWQQIIPNGTSFDWEDPEGGNFSGQCGEFVRWATNGSVRLGDSLDEKMSIINENIGLDEARVGDIFVQNVGGWTGHTGVVAAVTDDPNGGKIYTLMEANRNGDGKITTTTQLSSKDPTLMGFARGQLRPELTVGPDNSFIVPLSMATTRGVDQLTAAERFEARAIVAETLGKRAASDDTIVGDVYSMMADGLKPQEIRDNLLYSHWSGEFDGAIRDAAESVAVTGGMSEAKVDAFLNSVDRSLEEGNIDRAKELVLNTAIAELPAEQSKSLRGQLRTLDLIDEIETDLKAYEDAGGNTNIFSGNLESLLQRVGAVKDPKLAEIANKIAISIQRYRHDISGAAFTESEAKEYRAIFPNTNNLSTLNSIKINSLRDVFTGDTEFVLRQLVGNDAYEQLYVSKNAAAGGQNIPAGAFLYKDPKNPEQQAEIQAAVEAGWWVGQQADGSVIIYPQK